MRNSNNRRIVTFTILEMQTALMARYPERWLDAGFRENESISLYTKVDADPGTVTIWTYDDRPQA